MPRSTSTRKYRSHRDKKQYRRTSRHRTDHSRSRSRSGHRGNRKNHHKHHREYDRSRRKDSYRHRQRRYSSSDSERSRERSPSDYSRKRNHSRRSYQKYKKYDKYDKYDKYERKYKHQYKYKKSVESRTESNYSDESPVRPSSEDDKDRSKDAGHYEYREGTIINHQYRIIRHLGDGTFGRVIEAEDIRTHQIRAIKVIRAVERYVDSAQTEAEILDYIKSKDPEDRYQIVRMETAFLKDPSRPHKEQNYFMVFERLGMSLYDFLKRNNYRGFGIGYIQSFARQILTSVGFMHAIGLTHTDLKPENVLLVNDECVSVKDRSNSQVEDRSSTRSRSEGCVCYQPRYDMVKIIDMGGATYDHDECHNSTINTRQYRAPEVMLECCSWGHESDVWSIGCILIELFTGELFFETHETIEHLAMIDRACGPIPYWMANRSEIKMRKNFILDEYHYNKHRTYMDWPKCASGLQSVKRVENMKLINDVIPSEYAELRDLLKKMLTIDPKLRIRCCEALDHPFFRVKY